MGSSGPGRPTGPPYRPTPAAAGTPLRPPYCNRPTQRHPDWKRHVRAFFAVGQFAVRKNVSLS